MSNFTNSPLVAHTRLSPNRNSPRNQPIRKITIHHTAGNIGLENLGAFLDNPARRASYNYGISTDGRIGLFVNERDRSWASSSGANDHQAITIGVANNGGAPNWSVSDAAYNALIELCVDICRRNGIPRLVYDGTVNGTLTRHNFFSNTSCPGPFLQGRFPQIADEVNKRLSPPAPTPPPSTPAGSFSVGDIVQFTGGGVFISSTAATPAHSRGRSRCRVTQVNMRGRNPFHLVSEDNARVHGWVLPGDVEAIGGGTPSGQIVVGSHVRINAGARYFGGASIPGWVMSDTWIVSSVGGDRIVLGRNVSGRNNINSPVNRRDLRLA